MEVTSAKIPNIPGVSLLTPEKLHMLLGYEQECKPDSYSEVFAAPLVQIFSVDISTNFNDGRPCEVYGSIRATEGRGESFDLYYRDAIGSETMEEYGSLSLNDFDAILGSTRLTVDLCLRDGIRDIELIKRQHYLDCVTERLYDKLLKAHIQGERCSIYLYYATFRFAVYAIIEVVLDKKWGESGVFDDIWGSMVASYGNSRRYCTSDNELKILETRLFEKPSHKPSKAMLGTSLELSRCVVVVPAYSSLLIKADLWSGSQGRLSGLALFPAKHSEYYTKLIPSENGCLELKVKVKWKNALPWLYEEPENEIQDCITVADKNDDGDSGIGTPSKKSRVLSIQQLSSSSDLERNVPHIPPSIKAAVHGYCGVEVFSVYINCIIDEVSAVYGTIKVYDSLTPTFIFSKDSDEPELLSDDKIAGLVAHTMFSNPQFEVVLNLRDPIRNLEICKGEFGWNSAKLGSACGISWYDKRICSLVRGEHGYAAMHYMISYSSYQAIVEVTFRCDHCDGVYPNLYGILFGRYTGYEYETDYDKKYYKSRLVNVPRSKPLPLSSCSRIPLSKSVITVPTTSSLIIEADLKVFCDDNSYEDVVSGERNFVINLAGPTCQVIRGKLCQIEVSVNFEEPY